MPGRVMMDQAGAQGAVAGTAPTEKEKGIRKTAMNGDHGTLPNGVKSPVSESKAASLLDMPPEIRHVTEGLYSFPLIIERAARECHLQLLGLLRELQRMPKGSAGMTNGVHGKSINGDSVESSLSKKTKVMEFADKHKTVFLKLLVISDWTPRNKELRQIIDIWNHVIEQDTCYNNAAHWMAEQRRLSYLWKEPNPDIRTALEVLSTGKAPWMPDFNFIPPKPLTTKETLDLLRNMNTLLSVRLNLYEELPRHLRNYSIKNGRAVFTVPGEFELDVSIPDDKPESSFYFIDLRFIFNPPLEIPDGRFLAGLEPEMNNVLAATGLSGCFDYLHNFCMTLKIQTLRRQANKMLLSHWANAIRIEMVRRTLVVQYWVDMPGPKNWIEIGIASGQLKDSRASWRGSEPPCMSIRWLRNAKEHNDENGRGYDFSSLSMENVLRQAISKHIRGILETIHKNLQTITQSRSSLMSTIICNELDSSETRLEVTMTRRSNRVEVVIDPVTGKLVIRPSSVESIKFESRLNKDPNRATTAARLIVNLLGINLVAHIEKQAEQYGWERPTDLRFSTDDLKKALKQEVLQYAMFRGATWAQSSLLVVSIDSNAETWWLLELDEQIIGASIINVHEISTARLGPNFEYVTQDFLQRLESQAVSDVGIIACMRALKSHHINHQWDVQEKNSLHAKRARSDETDGLDISMLDLLVRALPGVAPSPELAGSVLQLSHLGFDTRQGKVEHVFKATASFKDSAGLGQIKAGRHNEVVFHENGGFQIRLRASFGKSCVEKLLQRLGSIYRLQTLVVTLRSQGVARPILIGLSSINFVYSKSPELSATIKFTEEQDAKFLLQLSHKNPQERLRQLLLADLNSPAVPLQTSIPLFIQNLIASLPLSQAIAKIQSNVSEPPFGMFLPPIFLPRSPTYHRISYLAPNPVCSFDVRLRAMRDDIVWHIEREGEQTLSHEQNANGSNSVQGARDEQLEAALKALWRKRGTEWFGIRTGIYAHVAGIEAALLRLDEVVRSCRREEDLRKMIEVTAKQVNVSHARTPKQQSQQQQQQQQHQPRPGLGNGRPNMTQQHGMHGRNLSQHQNQMHQGRAPQAQMQAPKHGQKPPPEVITLD